MKKIIFILLCSILFSSGSFAAGINIIPRPVSVTEGTGVFRITPQTVITVTDHGVVPAVTVEDKPCFGYRWGLFDTGLLFLGRGMRVSTMPPPYFFEVIE